MVEKKFVIDGMQLTYNGPFDIIQFYKTVEEWIASKGKGKDTKKKTEHVDPKGKKIEWFIEIWEDVNEYTRTLVRLRALFTDLKEAKVKKRRTKKLNKGNVLITLDGILETDLQGKWHQNPVFYFARYIADKFFYKHYKTPDEDKLAADVNNLHDTLTNFFGSYKI